MSKIFHLGSLEIGSGRPKTVVSLLGNTRRQLLAEAKQALKLAPDLLEWRADAFAKVDEQVQVLDVLWPLRKLLGATPLLFTFRSHAEGGRRQLSAPAYIGLCRRVAESGWVDLLDLELSLGEANFRGLCAQVQARGCRVIGSLHELAATPDRQTLLRRFAQIEQLGANLSKIAVQPQNEADLETLLAVSAALRDGAAERPFVALALGENGQRSRLAAGLFGSALAYASLTEAAAPGQIPLDQLAPVLAALPEKPTPVQPQTKLIGLLGYPLQQSFSAAAHNAVYRQLGLDYHYLPVAVADPTQLPTVLAGLRALNFAGLAVTKPYKQAILPFLDEMDDAVRQCGACNTVVNVAGRWHGYQTDGRGALAALQEAGLTLSGRRILCLGAGGTARAVCLALAQAGAAQIHIASPHGGSQRLAALMEVYYPGLCLALDSKDQAALAAASAASEIVLNLSGIGMAASEDETPLPAALLRREQFCFDAIYQPAETRFLHEAAANGCRTLNGLSMLTHQGAAQIQLWSGLPQPLEPLRQTLQEIATKK